jgi:hypothetical protein
MSQDKRIPLRQALELLHEFYDELEGCSLEALEKALHEALGIGPTRFERVKAVYLEKLGEAAEKRVETFKKQLKRRIK